jgi:predicted ester cyclase
VFEDFALGRRFEGQPARRRTPDVVGRVRQGGVFMGIEPTGRSIEVPVILIAELRDGLLGGERIYWDRATVLEQLGRPLTR